MSHNNHVSPNKITHNTYPPAALNAGSSADRRDVEPSLRVVALVESSVVNGAVKPLLTFAEALRAQGQMGRVDLRLLAFQRHPQAGENALAEAAARAGLPVTPIHERRVCDTSILDQLRAQFRKLQPDIVISLATKSHFLVRLLGIHKQCSWIACHHGYTRLDAKNIAYNQLDRWSLRAAATVVTVCDAFVPELLRAGVKRDDIRVLHNSIAPFLQPHRDEISRIRRTYGIGEHERVVFVAGRLSKEKGHIDLIDALGAIRRNHNLPRFRTIIAGDGPERTALDQRAQELGVSDGIIFAGFQSNVSPFYALSDVFVLPSHSEGSPNVLLEALAAGVPVIATRAGGVPEMLQGPYGETMLVEKQNPDALASKLVMVLRNDLLRSEMRQAAVELSRRFAPEAYAARFARILCAAAGRDLGVAPALEHGLEMIGS